MKHLKQATELFTPPVRTIAESRGYFLTLDTTRRRRWVIWFQDNNATWVVAIIDCEDSAPLWRSRVIAFCEFADLIYPEEQA